MALLSHSPKLFLLGVCHGRKDKATGKNRSIGRPMLQSCMHEHEHWQDLSVIRLTGTEKSSETEKKIQRNRLSVWFLRRLRGCTAARQAGPYAGDGGGGGGRRRRRWPWWWMDGQIRSVIGLDWIGLCWIWIGWVQSLGVERSKDPSTNLGHDPHDLWRCGYTNITVLVALHASLDATMLMKSCHSLTHSPCCC